MQQRPRYTRRTLATSYGTCLVHARAELTKAIRRSAACYVSWAPWRIPTINVFSGSMHSSRYSYLRQYSKLILGVSGIIVGTQLLSTRRMERVHGTRVTLNEHFHIVIHGDHCGYSPLWACSEFVNITNESLSTTTRLMR